MIRRAPDFFDWRSGVFEFKDDVFAIDQKITTLLTEKASKLSYMPKYEKIRQALEIKDLLEDASITAKQKFQLCCRLCALQNANGDMKSALKSFEKACEIDVREADDLSLKGKTMILLGFDDDALIALNTAIELKPDDASTWRYRGAALGSLGRYEEALSSFDKAIELKPDDAYAWANWANRGAALGSLGRHEEALSSFDKAIELNPDDADTWRYRGLALDKLGRHEEALSSCDKAIELRPNDTAAWKAQRKALETSESALRSPLQNQDW
jgi:superkiller protein 3